MTDREKVINELVEHIESALAVDSDYVDCVRTDLLQTVVGMLKAQEQKKKESRAMLPCKCGCKRREHWFGGDDPEKFEMLKCSHCGFTAYGKNATDVIRNWNKAVKADAET